MQVMDNEKDAAEEGVPSPPLTSSNSSSVPVLDPQGPGSGEQLFHSGFGVWSPVADRSSFLFDIQMLLFP